MLSEKWHPKRWSPQKWKVSTVKINDLRETYKSVKSVTKHCKMSPRQSGTMLRNIIWLYISVGKRHQIHHHNDFSGRLVDIQLLYQRIYEWNLGRTLTKLCFHSHDDLYKRGIVGCRQYGNTMTILVTFAKLVAASIIHILQHYNADPLHFMTLCCQISSLFTP